MSFLHTKRRRMNYITSQLILSLLYGRIGHGVPIHPVNIIYFYHLIIIYLRLAVVWKFIQSKANCVTNHEFFCWSEHNLALPRQYKWHNNIEYLQISNFLFLVLWVKRWRHTPITIPTPRFESHKAEIHMKATVLTRNKTIFLKEYIDHQNNEKGL